jgi:hypothetical protein
MKMKNLKTIVLSTIFMSVLSIANPLKIEKKVNNTIGKKGLLIALTHQSKHVEVDEISIMELNVTTQLKKGILKVNIKSLDNSLNGIDKTYLEFEISETKQSFPIEFQVSSHNAGIHYINFTFSMKNQPSRVIVVPVNIGTVNNKLSNKALQKNELNMNISVSKAEETIE